MDGLNIYGLRYMIARLLENAQEAIEERSKNPHDVFIQGRCLAYYEMFDILKSELMVRDVDLEAFGLNVDIDQFA